MNVREAETLFLRELPLLDRIIAATCRRNGFDPTDAEDFAGALRLKLIEKDYQAIRAFEGKSAFATYHTVIVQRFLIDYRNQRWGRWTPSTEATRLGECAVRLETLLHRDGRSFDDAVEILTREERIRTSRENLEALLSRLPRRQPRTSTRSLEESGAMTLRADDSADRLLFAREREEIGKAAARALDERIGALDPEDVLLLRMRYQKEMSVAQIARATGHDQRRLYHRLDKIARSLRQALERAGVDRGKARELLHSGSTFTLLSLGNPAAVPSNESGASSAEKVRIK